MRVKTIGEPLDAHGPANDCCTIRAMRNCTYCAARVERCVDCRDVLVWLFFVMHQQPFGVWSPHGSTDDQGCCPRRVKAHFA
jgi:hypothetical protein